MSPNPALLKAPAAGGGSFGPAALSPWAWYDPSDASTITATSGQVDQLRDKGGVSTRRLNHSFSGAVGPTTGIRTIGGLNVLDFNGTQMLFDAYYGSQPGNVLAQPYTVAMVIQTDNTAAERVAVALETGDSYDAYVVGGKWAARNGATLQSGAGVLNANPTLLVAVHNGATSTLRVNSAAYPGNVGTASGISRVILGTSNVGNPNFDGALGEVVIVPSALTNAQVLDLETYFKNKWGLP